MTTDDGPEKIVFVPTGFPDLHELKAIAAEHGFDVKESANLPAGRCHVVDMTQINPFKFGGSSFKDWFNDRGRDA